MLIEDRFLGRMMAETIEMMIEEREDDDTGRGGEEEREREEYQDA